MTNHALVTGFSQGYLVAAGISLLALVIAVFMMRVRAQDLAEIDPLAAPTG